MPAATFLFPSRSLNFIFVVAAGLSDGILLILIRCEGSILGGIYHPEVGHDCFSCSACCPDFFFFFNFLLFFSSQVYSASFFLNSLPTQSGVVVALTAQENFISTVGPKRRIKLFFFFVNTLTVSTIAYSRCSALYQFFTFRRFFRRMRSPAASFLHDLNITDL